jgi:CRISPR-associated protein Cmr6
MKYYSGERGPTEDQSPIPVKFMVVKSGSDFVFRLLLRQPLEAAWEKDQKKLESVIQKNLHRAISEEGMGAKTALGFGRFVVIATEEPEKVQGWLRKQQEDKEQKKHPWRPTLRRIESVTDWGQLKQLLGNKDIQIYQVQAEVGQTVKDAADRIRKASPKKWEEERDKLVGEWIKPSMIVWEPLAAACASVPDTLTPDEQAAVEQIGKIADWGAWKNAEKAGATLESLPLPALKKLREKFMTWKIKDGKGDKPTIWKALNKLISQK